MWRWTVARRKEEATATRCNSRTVVCVYELRLAWSYDGAHTHLHRHRLTHRAQTGARSQSSIKASRVTTCVTLSGAVTALFRRGVTTPPRHSAGTPLHRAVPSTPPEPACPTRPPSHSLRALTLSRSSHSSWGSQGTCTYRRVRVTIVDHDGQTVKSRVFWLIMMATASL